MAGEEIGTVNFVLELQEILCHQRADESGRRIIYEQEDLAGAGIPGVPDPGQYFLQDLTGKWIEKVDTLGVARLAYIPEIIRKGEVAPLEYSAPAIKDIIISSRKQTLISTLEQDLLKDARENGQFVIY
jgi:hypothetical protein